MEDNSDPQWDFVTKELTILLKPIKSMGMVTMFGLMAVLLLAAWACGGATPETIVVEKEVVKEVIKQVVVEKEIIKEVPVEVVVE